MELFDTFLVNRPSYFRNSREYVRIKLIYAVCILSDQFFFKFHHEQKVREKVSEVKKFASFFLVNFIPEHLSEYI